MLWCRWEERCWFWGRFPCLGKFDVLIIRGRLDGMGVYVCVCYLCEDFI